MGRLFWKIFFVILLAQLVTTNIVGSFLWLSHMERFSAASANDPRLGNGPPGPGPFGDGGPLPGRMPPENLRLDRPPMPLPDGFQATQARLGPEMPFPWFPVIVGCLASLFFAALLARHLSRPIMALRKAFGEVSRGNFDIHPVAEIGGRKDELAELGHDFEHTVRQLRGLIGAQRRLLHDVSHEVRSPLARMQLAIDLARQQPEKIEVSMQRVERESGRIDRLVGELLTLSRLEAGACGSMDEPVDIDVLVQEIVADARFEAAPLGRNVEFVADGEILVKGHPELLQRAIENVVRNAVRHTFDRTTVKVSLFVEGSILRICVDDDGTGLPENALDAIFEPFVRLNADRSNDGYGLGLAITRQTIEAHGGRVRAMNRPEGGLRVELTLPVCKDVSS